MLPAESRLHPRRHVRRVRNEDGLGHPLSSARRRYRRVDGQPSGETDADGRTRIRDKALGNGRYAVEEIEEVRIDEICGWESASMGELDKNKGAPRGRSQSWRK